MTGLSWTCWSSTSGMRAAKQFLRKLLKGLRYVPRVLVTDKLGNDQLAHGEALGSPRTSGRAGI